MVCGNICCIDGEDKPVSNYFFTVFEMKQEVITLDIKIKIMENQIDFIEDGMNELPSGLKTLTLLTFIGSAIAALFLIATPALYKMSSSFMDKALASGQDIPADKIAEIQKSKAAMAIAQANMVPTMVVGFIGLILCVVGAIWMRKLKKDGFWIYTAGELLPLIAGLILMGTAMFTGIVSILLGVGLPVLFVILYATQLKYLTR